MKLTPKSKGLRFNHIETVEIIVGGNNPTKADFLGAVHNIIVR